MAPEAHFSLFDGDRLNRLFALLHAPQEGRYRVIKRCVIVVLLTWIPVAVLALYGGLLGGGMTTTNFFADFAAHAQFLIAMPLFMLAEPIVEVSTRTADRQFIDCGIIRAQDLPKLHRVHVMLRRLRACRCGRISRSSPSHTHCRWPFWCRNSPRSHCQRGM